MYETDSRAGIFVIINEKTKRLFYVGADQLNDAIKEHTRFLSQGLHENKELQNDYDSQEGNGFIIKTIIEQTDMNSVRQILHTLLNLDDTKYNIENYKAV